MKKVVLFLCLAFVALAIQSCGSSSTDATSNGDGDGVREWTYMVYMAGDNSLSPMIDYDLAEMEDVGSNPDLAIVTQFESYNYYAARYYIGEHSSESELTYLDDEYLDYIDANDDDVDDNDPATDYDMATEDHLQAFIEWAITTYPAENYVLVLWDHGGGWRSSPPALQAFSRGAIMDDTSNYGYAMSIAQIASAIANAEASTSEMIDIIRFDACLMGMYEVAYEFNGLTDYLVFSEESVPGYGDPYDTILTGLKSNQDMTPRELAEFIVTTYDTNYDGEFDTTNSAIDMSQVSALDLAVTNLAALLVVDSTAAEASVSVTQDYSGCTGCDDYHDLYSLADYIADYYEAGINDELVAAAEAVKTAVDAAVVANETNGTTVEHSYGLSIYLPASDEINGATLTDYLDLSCNDRDDVTTWGDLIQAM